MKVVIVRDAPENIKQLMASQFPPEWHIVVVAPEFLLSEIAEADALIPEGSPIESAHLTKAGNLKIIQTGAGYDNLDIDACARRGIHVAHAAGINARAVAEHVLALIFCRYKNIIKLDAALKNGQWGVAYEGSELSDKVLGVV
ncbi:MAG: hypothetical protein V2I56_26850, partial [Desulfobacteraceae bacterium]|nr:hypothetical protein [Desulfobacteraceae bacterium]